MSIRPALFVSLSSVALLLSGCSSSFNPSTSSVSSAASSFSLTGKAYGGRQPISAARLYVLEANTTQYAGPGIAAASSNQSTSRITTGDGSDSIGNYVLTAADGSFNLTGRYTCTTGNQVYLFSTGGNTGSGSPNAAAGLMAALGTCGSDFGASTTVNLNELSTIAAAYALAGFASDATHIGASSSPLAQLALKNAFKSASQIFDITSSPYTGAPLSARTATPGGNGIVPTYQVNTLANILAACVNSAGSGFSQCSTLFSDIRSGGATGTAPTETATAAIYLAQHPGVNVDAIYGITGSASAAYAPWFSTSSPSDFTIAIRYSGGGVDHPYILATDASGYVWVGNSYSNQISQFDPFGDAVTGANGYSTNIGVINDIALDADGNLWVANLTSNSVTKITVASEVIISSSSSNANGINLPSGLALDGRNDAWIINNSSSYDGSETVTGITSSGAPVPGTPFPTDTTGTTSYNRGIAVDSLNNVWIANYNASSVSRVATTGGVAGPSSNYAGSGLDRPVALAIDQSNNAWTVSQDNNSLSRVSSTGSIAGPFIGGGILYPVHLSIDGSSGLWVTNEAYGAQYGGGSVSAFDNTATAQSANGYVGPGSTDGSGAIFAPFAAQPDISGNLWVAEYGHNALVELLGAATPTCQPLAACINSNKLGQRP